MLKTDKTIPQKNSIINYLRNSLRFRNRLPLSENWDRAISVQYFYLIKKKNSNTNMRSQNKFPPAKIYIQNGICVHRSGLLYP